MGLMGGPPGMRWGTGKEDEFSAYMKQVEERLKNSSMQMRDAERHMEELGNQMEGMFNTKAFMATRTVQVPPPTGNINLNIELEALRQTVRFHAPSLDAVSVDIMAMILAREYVKLAGYFKNADGSPRAWTLTLVDENNR
jgi:hypothetical protein